MQERLGFERELADLGLREYQVSPPTSAVNDATAQRKMKSWALLPHQLQVLGRGLVPLAASELNPGFYNADGGLKTTKALQDLLNQVAQKRDFKNLAIALVDLSQDLNLPHFAGHLSDRMVFAASIPKIAAMLTAFQLRCDLRALAASTGVKTATDLFGAARSAWFAAQKPAAGSKENSFLTLQRHDALLRQNGKAIALIPRTLTQSRTAEIKADKIKLGSWVTIGRQIHGAKWKIPALEKLFQVNTTPSPLGVDFMSTFKANLDLMIGHSDNGAAAICIDAVGYLSIGSVLMQTGLVDPARGGGLWLRANYGGRCVEKRDLQVKSKKYTVCVKQTSHGHDFAPFGGPSQASTAASLAAFFTLLAQRRLVDPGSSREMLDIMDKSKPPGNDNRSPLTEGIDMSVPTKIYSKLGLAGGFSDAVLVERTVGGKTLTYVASALSAELGVIKRLGQRLEECIRRNNGV